MENINKTNFYLLGLFCTFNALMLTIGGKQLAIINFILIAIYLIQMIKTRVTLNYYSYRMVILILFTIFIISSIGSLYFIGYDYFKESITASLKFFLFLSPVYLLFNDMELLKYRKYFFKGLFLSCLIELIWEFLQIILWQLNKFSLNEFVFGQILNLDINHSWTFVRSVSNIQYFRPSGLSWEPANLGMSLIVGYILSKNWILKILFMTGIFLSSSRSAILMLVLCLIVEFIRRKKSETTKESTLGKKIFFILILGIIIFIILHSLKKFSLVDTLSATLVRFLGSDDYIDYSANTHASYYSLVVDLILRGNIFYFLFGYGTDIAGYPYTLYYGIKDSLEWAWTPESDFISILIGNGLFGFIAYYVFCFKNLMINKNNNRAFLILISLIFGGILYLYYRSTWPLLMAMLLFIKEEKSISDKTDISII